MALTGRSKGTVPGAMKLAATPTIVALMRAWHSSEIMGARQRRRHRSAGQCTGRAMAVLRHHRHHRHCHRHHRIRLLASAAASL